MIFLKNNNNGTIERDIVNFTRILHKKMAQFEMKEKGG